MGKGCGSGSWKWKRLNFCENESVSTLKKEAGSRSKKYYCFHTSGSKTTNFGQCKFFPCQTNFFQIIGGMQTNYLRDIFPPSPPEIATLRSKNRFKNAGITVFYVMAIIRPFCYETNHQMVNPKQNFVIFRQKLLYV